jgi:hypothetical protein
MSGEGTTPPVVLDEQTLALIESLIKSGVQTALAARAAASSGAHAASDGPAVGLVNGGDAGAGALATATEERGGRATADDAQAGDERDELDASDPQPDCGGVDSKPGDSGRDSGGVSNLDVGAATSDQAFNVAWYEARRGEEIAPRFKIHERFDPRYPFGFAAESIVHYRTFCVGGASPGRESEANALSNSAAYLTEISNAIDNTVRTLRAIESRVPAVHLEQLRGCRLGVSDAQLALFGVYELTASRYEILCGLQGARGVADPALLESYVDAPTAYSTTGR